MKAAIPLVACALLAACNGDKSAPSAAPTVVTAEDTARYSGIGEGETVLFERPGVRPERIVLDKVLYQPEAARRSRHVLPKAAESRRLVLVHSAGDDWQPPENPLGGPGKIRHRGGDDDGPSAA